MGGEVDQWVNRHVHDIPKEVGGLERTEARAVAMISITSFLRNVLFPCFPLNV